MQEAELEMCAAVEAAEAEVHAALCNNIATKDALDALSRLITHTQKYKELGFRAPPGAPRRLAAGVPLGECAASVCRPPGICCVPTSIWHGCVPLAESAGGGWGVFSVSVGGIFAFTGGHSASFCRTIMRWCPAPH